MVERGGSASIRPDARFDWALLLIPLLGLVAIWPLVTQPMPSTDDGALHMFRIAELDRGLRHGITYMRWAPDFAHGYGYPGFNYYINLPTFIAELWHLIGLGFPQAVAATLATAFLVSGWGAYLLGRSLAGRKAGLIVATAYMYAPYQFYDSAYRGNLPEMWALAWLPWVLWAARYAITHRRWRSILPFVLVYAALVDTHNVYTVMSSTVLGAYLLMLWWVQGHKWREFYRMGAMVGLGIALAAFFWLPAFFEQGWTRYSPVLFDYERSFLQLSELLAWPPQVDLSLLNYYPPRSLNWGMLIVIVLGMLPYLLDRQRGYGRVSPGLVGSRSVEWAFFLAVLLFASLMTLDASAGIWRAIRPLQVIQMPWRYLGIASLAGSVCAGVMAGHLLDWHALVHLALPGTGLAITLLIAFAVPWTYAAPFPQPVDIGVSDMVRWEYGTGSIGGTSVGEFLPVWAVLPEEPADPALLTERDPIIARLDETSLPDGARVISADYELLDADLVIDTPRAFRAVYKQFYFPDWQVIIDGRPVSPIVTAPYGLLGFDVPAGRHEIAIRHATTPLRTAGNAITALAALAAVGILVMDRRAPSPVLADVQDAEQGAGMFRRSWAREGVPLAVLALLILVVKEGLIDRTDNLFRTRRFDGDRVPGVQAKARVNFGDMLTLHGYDLPRRAVTFGEPLRVDLYLSARRAVDGDYMAYARLVDDEGRLWSLPDNGTPDGFRPPPPTTIWPTDAYGHWAYLAYTLPGTPPGEYWIEVALFERDTWRGLNVLDAAGRIAGLTTRIGPVQITRPRTPPEIDALGVVYPSQAQITPALRYVGSTQGTRSAEAGGALDITLFWQAVQKPTADYSLRVSIVGGEDTLVLGENLPLGRHSYPTAAWERGQVVRSPHRLLIPASVEAGTYAIEGTVFDGQGAPVSSPIQLGEIEIASTDRVFAIPSGIQHRADANLENTIVLVGYDLPAVQVAQGDVLPVTLYWQAMREMRSSYKVSVQLVGEDGVLVQADAIPVAWTRPTTGWVSGEVLVDAYDLVIPTGAPAGTYRLIVGVYQEQSLLRLNVLDAWGGIVGDHVTLGMIAVE